MPGIMRSSSKVFFIAALDASITNLVSRSSVDRELLMNSQEKRVWIFSAIQLLLSGSNQSVCVYVWRGYNTTTEKPGLYYVYQGFTLASVVATVCLLF